MRKLAISAVVLAAFAAMVMTAGPCPAPVNLQVFESDTDAKARRSVNLHWDGVFAENAPEVQHDMYAAPSGAIVNVAGTHFHYVGPMGDIEGELSE